MKIGVHRQYSEPAWLRAQRIGNHSSVFQHSPINSSQCCYHATNWYAILASCDRCTASRRGCASSTTPSRRPPPSRRSTCGRSREPSESFTQPTTHTHLASIPIGQEAGYSASGTGESFQAFFLAQSDYADSVTDFRPCHEGACFSEK